MAKVTREAMRAYRQGKRRLWGERLGSVFAQIRTTMKKGPVKIWVTTSQRFHSFGDEIGGAGLGEFVTMLDSRLGWWRGRGSLGRDCIKAPSSGSTMLIDGDLVPCFPYCVNFGGSAPSALLAESVEGLSGGSVAITVEAERDRDRCGESRPGSGSTMSGNPSSSSLSTSTTGKVIARRNTLGAATRPKSFSQTFLSFHE